VAATSLLKRMLRSANQSKDPNRTESPRIEGIEPAEWARLEPQQRNFKVQTTSKRNPKFKRRVKTSMKLIKLIFNQNRVTFFQGSQFPYCIQILKAAGNPLQTQNIAFPTLFDLTCVLLQDFLSNNNKINKTRHVLIKVWLNKTGDKDDYTFQPFFPSTQRQHKKDRNPRDSHGEPSQLAFQN